MELKEVFEPVLNFIKKLQKKDNEIASKQAAKDRLKLVLMQDRASVSPDFFELMKQEIIDVIKKYIEIDEESLEVQLTRGIEAGLEGPALYANIPIRNVKPVAPQGESEEETIEMTEEKADKIADQILNEIESVSIEDNNVGFAPQGDPQKTDEHHETEEISVRVDVQGDPVTTNDVTTQKEEQPKPKKTTTTKKSATKATTKATTKKTTKTTTKKDTKK